MTETALLDKTYHILLERMVSTGRAPHHTEVAASLGVPPEAARKAIRKLFSTPGFAGWLYPKTDNIVSLAPFNNLSNHFRLTIEGEQKWFGQ